MGQELCGAKLPRTHGTVLGFHRLVGLVVEARFARHWLRARAQARTAPVWSALSHSPPHRRKPLDGRHRSGASSRRDLRRRVLLARAVPRASEAAGTRPEQSGMGGQVRANREERRACRRLVAVRGVHGIPVQRMRGPPRCGIDRFAYSCGAQRLTRSYTRRRFAAEAAQANRTIAGSRSASACPPA